MEEEEIVQTEADGAQEEEQAPEAASQQEDLEVQILEKARKIAEEIARNEAERAIRTSQSLTDKMEARIRRETQTVLDYLNKLGVQANPRDVEMIARDTVIEEARRQPENSPAYQQLYESVNRTAQEMVKEYGVTIEESDPEVQLVNFDDPFKFITTLDKALRAKADRTQQQQMATKSAPKATRAPVSSKGESGLPDNMSVDDLLNLAYHKG